MVLAIPSNGIHSNGYSLVRLILKKYKIPKILKNEILRPTKIYSEEVLKLAIIILLMLQRILQEED